MSRITAGRKAPRRPRWKWGVWLFIVLAIGSAVGGVGKMPKAGAAGEGQYSAPEWWPMRGTHVVGCTNQNGCLVPNEGYHGYWALDINSTTDTEIYPAGAGRVRLAIGDQGGNCDFRIYHEAICPDGSRGNLVVIDHDATGEVNTLYLHFSNVVVKTGDWVDTKTVLGTAGNSGLAYPGYVHLHFELRHRRFDVEPVPLKACHGDQLVSYPGELGGRTSWSQVTAYEFSVRSDGTACAPAVIEPPPVPPPDPAEPPADSKTMPPKTMPLETTTTTTPMTTITTGSATPTVVAARAPLARTGSPAGRLAVVATCFVGLGVALVVSGRRAGPAIAGTAKQVETR